jgi:hypothetical protein
MSSEDYTKEKLWPTLVETVHALVLYPSHKAYVRDIILSEKPEITVDEMAIRLNMPKGEALVILTELAQERTLKA